MNNKSLILNQNNMNENIASTSEFVGRKGDKVYANDTVYDIQEMQRDADCHASVYCGTFGRYNQGSLYGCWIPLNWFDTYEEFLAFCRAFHSGEKDPEFMFQDYQYFPDSWYCESGIGEHFDDILEYDKLDEDDQEAAEAWINMGRDISDWRDHYQGAFDSEKDFAEYWFDEVYYGQVPDFLVSYIDYDAVARDLFCGDYTFQDGYVFDCA